jgi:benzoyl-CoA reductase/2-hydroxyglutaryl-CoA dehydratase subunit BcrC/BadD/HgdB
VLLNDRLTDCRNEVEALRYNAGLDSMELAANRQELAKAKALQQHTEDRLSETVEQVNRCEVRESQLSDAVAKSGKVAKRRERLAWVLAGVAAAEAVVIGVWVALR